MAERASIRPVVLCILDGWGHCEETDNNAIAQASTPVYDRWLASYPHSLIDCAESEVGLPHGQMGNSEVGHMNLGAGRVVLQDLPRIDSAVETGELAILPALQQVIDALKANGGTAHLLGLMSPGGVHSHQDHIAAVANVLSDAGVAVAVHAILDGRDTPPRSALGYLERFAHEAPEASIATVCGRFYAMDRDKRWDRVQRAYEGMVAARGETAASAREAVEASYQRDEADEFVRPTAIGGYAGMRDGDALLMLNFRADRAREILETLLLPEFDGFERSRRVEFAKAVGLAEYSSALNPHLMTLFPAEELSESLGEVVSRAGLRQLRIAETEKYAHVTFFFNGGREEPFEGEERVLIPSPKVATYDLQPEMSAPELTDRLTAAIDSGAFDLIVVNYANCDMVGHTGNLGAAMQAVQAIDSCMARLEESVTRAGGCLLMTADHGNAEQMSDPHSGQAHTAHTMNRVPLVLVNAPASVTRLGDGRLADLAPTVLALMGLDQPAVMSGRNLVNATVAAQAERA